MDQKTLNSCPWMERVSALLDGELPAAQRQMVESHAQSCATCAPFLEQNNHFEESSHSQFQTHPRLALTFPQRSTPQLRALLVIVGVLILLGSVPEFIRGNIDGNSLHDLRHLSIWQVAIGVGALSAAISFRISRLLTAIISTFLLLSALATIYDLLAGHRGPWTDPLHVVEIAAVLVMMKMIYPHLNRFKIRPKVRASTGKRN